MAREFRLGGAPHIPPSSSVQGVMAKVLLALLPGTVVAVVWSGPGVLLQIALACGFALLAEAAMLQLRGRPLRPFLSDLSAPVTAMLFALCIPPWAPWWIAAVGMLAAVVLAKHLYGGLGYNVFNPAMVGYVVVLIAFTRELSAWPASGASPGFSDMLGAVFGNAQPWDTMAQATPLDALRDQLGQGRTLDEIRAGPAFGTVAGRGSEWIALGWLCGGLWLLQQRIISWQVPAGVAAGVVAVALPLWLYDAGRHASPLFHLVAGATLLGAFFIATDPVSGASTPRGRFAFGAGVGVLTVLIRSFGAFPDGVAFGVLLMNGCAPLLDRWTRPRVFGHPR
jgi:electron transport complex protein RnfD